MSRLALESKITGKQSLRPIGSSLIYTPMSTTNEAFYEDAVVHLDAEGTSG